MLRRRSIRLLVVAFALAYAHATFGDDRAVAAAGTGGWDAAIENPALGSTSRGEAPPACRLDRRAPACPPLGTLGPAPVLAPPASHRFVSPCGHRCHRGGHLETGRTARGPPPSAVSV